MQKNNNAYEYCLVRYGGDKEEVLCVVGEPEFKFKLWSDVGPDDVIVFGTLASAQLEQHTYHGSYLYRRKMGKWMVW